MCREMPEGDPNSPRLLPVRGPLFQDALASSNSRINRNLLYCHEKEHTVLHDPFTLLHDLFLHFLQFSRGSSSLDSAPGKAYNTKWSEPKRPDCTSLVERAKEQEASNLSTLTQLLHMFLASTKSPTC
jgi:hypothetical protein